MLDQRRRKIERIAAAILVGIAVLEAVPLVLSLRGVGRALLHSQSIGAVAGAVFIAGAYIVYAGRTGGIRRHLADRSWLRVPAVFLAVIAGIFEEAYFRSVLMNGLAGVGIGVALQVAASGVAFGAAHAIWGLFGGWRVLVGAMFATTLLGLALAVLYVLDGRVLVPCIEAHVLIDLVLEPALVLFALEQGFERRGRRAAMKAAIATTAAA